MRIKLIILGLAILFVNNIVLADNTENSAKNYASGVICSRSQRRCVVGEHVIRTNGRKPLYIRDGVVCTPNKRTCTNGFSWMHSNKPLF